MNGDLGGIHERVADQETQSEIDYASIRDAPTKRSPAMSWKPHARPPLICTAPVTGAEPVDNALMNFVTQEGEVHARIGCSFSVGSK